LWRHRAYASAIAAFTSSKVSATPHGAAIAVVQPEQGHRINVATGPADREAAVRLLSPGLSSRKG
jgi:hypothetical protein